MSSHDELHRVLSASFEGLNRELNEARSKAEKYRLDLDTIRSILLGVDPPEKKLERIGEVLK